MSASQPQRGVLPIPDRQHLGLTTYDAKDPATSFPPIEPLLPPEGAPNVLIVLLDDVGFGASSAFGGPVSTPTAERLQRGGLTYNRFHTTALCAPTRAALLSGRNHHSVGMGSITESATSAPGMSGVRPNTKAALATTLKLNGYSTAQFGKCHEVPPWQTSPVGPFDAWPSGGGGFEYFYGFIGGENNQYYPALYEGTTPVEPDRSPAEGYHLTEDLADRAVDWVRTQKALAPDKPFFLYFAPGATHAPHHVPLEWADRYAGRFADGWDEQRRSIFARQQEMGIVPPDSQLTERPDVIPPWDEMDDALKPVLERQMEVYAGFLEHTDFHVGRLIDAIESIGALENTLVYYIVGDNGASAEGTVNGAFNEMANFNGLAAIETPEFMAAMKDKLGTEEAYNHYSVGWAWAMCAPYQWTKQVASHWGGTRNGTIVHWPAGIEAAGGTRSQFCHVIDVAPTVLEVAGLPEPTMVNGVLQSPIEGTSMLYTFADADAPERHDLQYFEMFGNRGIYFRGWSAVTRHSTPWLPTETLPALDDDIWELYDGSTDWTQADDLAEKMPEMLANLQRLWLIEAVKYQVLPIDDRRFERLNADPRRPPAADHGRQPGSVPRHEAAQRALGPRHQEPVLLRDGVDRDQRGRHDERRDHRAGRTLRRLGAVCQGRSWRLRLQPPRHDGVHRRGDRGDPAGQPPGPGGVPVRRWGAGQGRRRDPVLRRARGRQRSHRAHAAHHLLGRRDDGHRRRLRHAGQRRVRRVEPVQRSHRRRADRCRRRRPDPPHRPGRGCQSRHLQAVARHSPDRSGQAAAARTTRVSA